MHAIAKPFQTFVLANMEAMQSQLFYYISYMHRKKTY